MGRKRNTHKSLPERWVFNHGKYYYLVPKGEEDKWDGKKWFNLGKDYAEALTIFSGRIAKLNLTTFNNLFDAYIIDVLPFKATATQYQDKFRLEKLREIIGEFDIKKTRPANGVQIQDALFEKVQERNKNRSKQFTGFKNVKETMSLLKLTLQYAVDKGLIEVNPLASFKMSTVKRMENNKKKTTAFIPSWDHIDKCLPHAPRWLQLYIKLKSLTGLRQTDLLRLSEENCTAEGLFIDQQKTRGYETPQSLLFEWTPELEETVLNIQALHPSSPLFFPNYTHNEYGVAERFGTQWKAFQAKLKQKEIKPFAERYIRNRVGHEGDLDEASKRLGHTNPTTTSKYYRTEVVSTVKPVPTKH